MIRRVQLGKIMLEVTVDETGIITDVTGDPRGNHYIGTSFKKFEYRTRSKQMKRGAYKRER